MMRTKPLLIIVLLFAFLLAGCTSGDVADTVHSTPAPDKSSSSENHTENIDKISDKEGTTVNINDVMEFPDLGELIITKAEFADEVHPPNPNSFHSYYKPETSDKEFFHLVGIFKNKSKNDVQFNIFIEDPIEFRLVYKEKYKYDGFIVVEKDGGGDFAMSKFVEPLTSATIHALIEVPKEVRESGEVITVIIKAGETTYNMKFNGE